MKKDSQIENKKVFVLGLAKSGAAISRVLHNLGCSLLVNDLKRYEENEEAQQLEQLGIPVICGRHAEKELDESFDVVVKNPGIPYTNPIVEKAIALHIPVVTEVEIASFISEAPIIGITGSNGKTTTTTLIYEILKASEKHPLIAGNIGTVACSVAEKAKEREVMVTELSSFQLQGTVQFHPKIAVLLNLFDAHLDYHGTKEAYIQAKASIFANQIKEDYAVLNMDDETVWSLRHQINSTIVPFSQTKEAKDGAYVHEQMIYFKEQPIIAIKDIVLPGNHNIENILAAVATTKLYGATNEAIVHVLKTFTGVEHRLQYVTEKKGRKFYNDSKATNMLATQKALSAFTQPIVLIAGGLDRGNGFDDLIPYFSHVRALVTYGETKHKLKDSAEKAGVKNIVVVETLEEAVGDAWNASEAGDIVLLSPACASWDQFKTFEQRGDMFVHFVHTLL